MQVSQTKTSDDLSDTQFFRLSNPLVRLRLWRRISRINLDALDISSSPILDTLYKSSRALDLKLATTAALLGYGLETIWVKLAILKFGDSTLPPIWMGFLWLGFALTINHSMKFFRDLTIVGPLIVGLFGPLTYLAGQRLGAVTIENYYLLLLIIPCWIGLFQLLKMQSSWLDKTDLVHTAKNIRPKQDANPSD